MSDHPDWAYASLTPERILNDLESLGWRCDGRLIALNSYENRVYQVGLEEGEPVVAKFYRPGRWSPEQLQEEHFFLQELHEEEIPVVSPLSSPETGQTLSVCETFPIAVFPRRGGYALEMDQADQLYRIGCALGRLHNVGSRTKFSHRPALNTTDFGHAAIEQVLQSPLLPEAMRDIYRSVATDLIAGVEQALEGYGPWQALRLHGDCHAANIMVRDELMHIVDFDDARSGPAVQDLWLFLSGDNREQRLALSEILEGYEEFREFDRRELALIEPLRSLRVLHYAGWLSKRWDDPAFPAAFPWLAEARFWDQHVLDLREQLAALQEPVELSPY
ncbi:MAG: serine/threonine protein kinase [Granulosicoccaceae bacterium]